MLAASPPVIIVLVTPVISPPINKSPPRPIPPSTLNAPVIVDVLAVVSST